MEIIEKQLKNFSILELYQLNTKIYNLIATMNKQQKFNMDKFNFTDISEELKTLIEIPRNNKHAVRLCNVLHIAEIKYFEDLENITENELRKFRNIGNKTMSYFKHLLNEQNLKNNTNFQFKPDILQNVNPTEHIYS